MSGFGNTSMGSGGRRVPGQAQGQGDWQGQMGQSGMQQGYGDEGMGSDPLSGGTGGGSQRYSSGSDPGYDQQRATAGGTQGQSYQGGSTQAYPQQGGGQGMQGSRMRGDEPGDQGMSSDQPSQTSGGSQGAQQGDDSGGLFGKLGKKAQQAAGKKFGGM